METLEPASEVARLRAEIEQQCTASWRALHELASGNAQHRVISARMRQMDAYHQRLGKLIGDEQATELVCEIFDQVGEVYAPASPSSAQSASRQPVTRSTLQPALRKVVLLREEK